jgi:hypothetical protein
MPGAEQRDSGLRRLLVAPARLKVGDIFFTAQGDSPQIVSQGFRVTRVQASGLFAWSVTGQCTVEFDLAGGRAADGELIVVTGEDLGELGKMAASEAIDCAQSLLDAALLQRVQDVGRPWLRERGH